MKTVSLEKQRKKPKICTDIVSLRRQKVLSQSSQLIKATKTGLTFKSGKKFFFISQKEIPLFVNHPVKLFLSQYEIPFYGVIKKISPGKKNFFVICVDFMKNVPLYYRECVEELLN